MTTQKPELMPCPFCGSADIDPEGVFASKDGGENYSYPACNDCSASCEDWNTRTGLYTTACAERDALRALCEGMARAITASIEGASFAEDGECYSAVHKFDCSFLVRVTALKKALTAYEKHKAGV